jgi:hypothetical protein
MTSDTDEQDLVKALDNVAGAASSVGGTAPASFPTPPSDTMSNTTVTSPFSNPTAPMPQIIPDHPSSTLPPYLADPAPAPVVAPSPAPASDLHSFDPSAPTTDTGPLASIKQDALVELRPLVDKLNVSPEEKFDTYLLLIRSTDDTDLIAPAHEAAKAITDETRRAEALLDIIKEIDFLSHSKKSES